MASDAVTFKTKLAAEQFAAAGNHKVFVVADVYVVVVSDRKIDPITFHVWTESLPQ